MLQAFVTQRDMLTQTRDKTRSKRDNPPIMISVSCAFLSLSLSLRMYSLGWQLVPKGFCKMFSESAISSLTVPSCHDVRTKDRSF